MVTVNQTKMKVWSKVLSGTVGNPHMLWISEILTYIHIIALKTHCLHLSVLTSTGFMVSILVGCSNPKENLGIRADLRLTSPLLISAIFIPYIVIMFSCHQIYLWCISSLRYLKSTQSHYYLWSFWWFFQCAPALPFVK